jgi:hypothetical protein
VERDPVRRFTLQRFTLHAPLSSECAWISRIGRIIVANRLFPGAGNDKKHAKNTTSLRTFHAEKHTLAQKNTNPAPTEKG